MKRLSCLVMAIGLGLLAVNCWLGETAPFPQLNSGLLSGWSMANAAYAAPPSRGIVMRAAQSDSLAMEDDTPGVVVSDHGGRVVPAGGSPAAARSDYPRSRPSQLQGYDSALSEDEPQDLTPTRPLPARQSPAVSEHFVQRRRPASNLSNSRSKEPAVAEPTLAEPALAEPALVQPKRYQTSTPTLADPRAEQSFSAEDRSATAPAETENQLPVIEYAEGESDAAREPLPRPRTTTSRAMPAAPRRYEVPAVEPSVTETVEEKLPSAEIDPNIELAPLEEPKSHHATAQTDDSPFATSSAQLREVFEVTTTPAPAESTKHEHAAASEPQLLQHGVRLHWVTPAEVQVDTETEFQLNLENATDGALSQVVVEAQLPAGVRLVRTEPAANDAEAKLDWSFASLEAHEQRTIHLWVVPTGEGQVEPTATVTFSHATAARLQVIHPQLQLDAQGPATTLAGQPAGVRFVVSNPGSGKARNVVLQVQLDPALKHAAGNQLRYTIGSLASGESREVQVALNPTEAGNFQLQATTTGEPGLTAEARYELEVSKPTLHLAVEGPRLRYVDRQATYLIKVHNPGPSPAENVQVFDDVPSGFRFVDASSGGTFDASARQVAWFVGRIEPNQTTEVNVQLIATEPGEQTIAAAVKADAGVSETAEAVTRVEGVASVVLDVIDADDPIEVAGETTYEIRLTNRGTQPARQVQPAAKLPVELQAVEATGPTTGKIDGQTVVFEPIEALAPGQTEVFRVRVLCKKEGQVTFRAFYRDADHPNAVAEEEVTRVYQD